MKMPFQGCEGCRRRRERLLQWLGLKPSQETAQDAQAAPVEPKEEQPHG